MSYKQFSNTDSSFVEHVDWDKVYAIVAHMIMDIVGTYIDYVIEFSFDEFQRVVNLFQDDILMDMAICSLGTLVHKVNLKSQYPQNNEIIKDLKCLTGVSYR